MRPRTALHEPLWRWFGEHRHAEQRRVLADWLLASRTPAFASFAVMRLAAQPDGRVAVHELLGLVAD